jgi:hypothetical protein
MPGSTTTTRPFWTALTCLLWAAMCAFEGCSGGAGTAPGGRERQPSLAETRVEPQRPAAGTAKHKKGRPEARDFKSFVLGKR